MPISAKNTLNQRVFCMVFAEAGMLISPFAGHLAKRFGVRPVLRGGLGLAGHDKSLWCPIFGL